MGMDVCGKKPTTEQGEYFCNSVWWWRPLANYVCEVAPEIAGHCEYWQTNDGDGLNAEDSAALADKLQQEIDSGHTERFAAIYAAEQELTPNEPCHLCEGTGFLRPPAAGVCGAGDILTGIKCNACAGNGFVPPFPTHYRFSVENVRNFVAFLRGCGGFAIL
jgi:hypothetical protein